MPEAVKSAIDSATEWLLDRASLSMVKAKLFAIASLLNYKPSLRRHLRGTHPLGVPYSFEAKIQWVEWDRSDGVHLVFEGGRVRVGSGVLAEADATVRYKSPAILRAMFASEGDPLDLIINNDIAIEGSFSAMAKLDHMVRSVLLKGVKLPLHESWAKGVGPERWQDVPAPPSGEPCAAPPAGEAAQLDDPYLARYTLDDFPRIKRRLWEYRTELPEICSERARLLTEFVLQEKLAGRSNGANALRQARGLRHILARKRPIVREDDLIAGTTTAKRIGVPLYPELGATWGWSELFTFQARELNPYLISDEEIRILNEEVFPFWLHDNVRQYTLEHADDPRPMHLDMRFALYFMWKTQAISHTVIDVPRALRRGIVDIRNEAAQLEREADAPEKRDFYRALQIALDGVVDFSRRLALRASEMSDEIEGSDAEAERRRGELRALARICEEVPARPPETLREAIQAIWTLYLAEHQESFNAAMVLGRLDVWLEPYFQRDLERIDDPEQRRSYVEQALELCCALMLKTTDNVPFKESAGNRIFSGSTGNAVITLGGLAEDGSSAVCDMTWILLKATEMLGLRDPNVNARFAPGVNSEAYLRRLCEVNKITRATPSLHNDDTVVPALVNQGFTVEHARDWTATGCVEPTSCGRHLGHTNCMMANLVAPLEMALNDGVHPLIGEQVGPRTGDPRAFNSYEDFYGAFRTQLGWLIDMTATANNMLGRTHQLIKPTPLLSALFSGPMEKGKDVTAGGAIYNTSGTAMVGLTDVVDSLAAIKTLVFEQRRVDFGTLLEALAADFEGHELLLSEILHKAPKFGREEPLTLEIARELMDFVYDRYQAQEHYRGGRYVPGYWSMSYHVAFGDLSGALPSGRRRGKAFTPGLTPSHLSGAGLTDQIRTVAALDPIKMPNNIAFNVKVVPGQQDTHQRVLDRMSAYVGSYFELGGMQMQFNVTSTETLRQAMENPDDHRDLLVRISGYNVYFVDLTREAQLEVIERTEHSLGG